MDLGNKLRLGLAWARYKLTGRRIPVAVAWLITGRCNLHCAYCKWKDQRTVQELDTPAVKDMIDQMAEAGVRVVSFTGGEPLVREDMGEIVHYVKDKGLVCKLNTNGLLVPKRIEEFRTLDLLQVSMDGPPSRQDALRGRGTSERAMRAVELAREAGIRTQVITCLTRENVEHLGDVLDYGLEHDVAFCFQLLTAKTLDAESTDRSVPSREALRAALERLREIKTSGEPRARAIGSKRSELDYYLDLLQSGPRGCDCVLVTATMMPDGKLIFCGSANECDSHDAVELGFAEAFSRLSIPDCDGCVCVGKLRLSKVYQTDVTVIREFLGW